MTPRTFCFTLLSILAASIAANLPAQAQRARVFVSVTGNDANPCTAGSPCKTFQTAYNAVLAGGEISVLDTGGYGTLTIAKALSIVSPAGVEASIAIPSGGTGITISAGSSDKVSLRGLTLDGQGMAGFGIDFVSGQSLTVEDCIVRNMTIDGLDFFSFTSAPQTLTVSNSYFTDNAGSGLVIKTVFTGAVTVSIDKTGFNGNVGNGLPERRRNHGCNHCKENGIAGPGRDCRPDCPARCSEGKPQTPDCSKRIADCTADHTQHPGPAK